jgi:hypothetical protein
LGSTALNNDVVMDMKSPFADNARLGLRSASYS